jgi:hypothetical protein
MSGHKRYAQNCGFRGKSPTNPDDALGGANVLSNASGTVAEGLAYYPFGGMRFDHRATTFGEQRRFTGHEFDQGTGLNYMDARYQGPTLSRSGELSGEFYRTAHLGKQLISEPMCNSHHQLSVVGRFMTYHPTFPGFRIVARPGSSLWASSATANRAPRAR